MTRLGWAVVTKRNFITLNKVITSCSSPHHPGSDKILQEFGKFYYKFLWDHVDSLRSLVWTKPVVREEV